jgi:Cu2+-exporting ATPase
MVPAMNPCFHCGLPVPAGSAWLAEVDGVAHAMCCPGCAAVATSIVDAGMAAYYRDRSVPATSQSGAAMVPAELFDASSAIVQRDGQAETVLSVDGIRCAACVWLIERHLGRMPGMAAASLNVATERLSVSWDPAVLSLSVIVAAMRRIGYSAAPYDAGRHAATLDKARKRMFRQLFIAGLSMMQVMMYAVPVYLADAGTMDASMEALMEWASLVLTLPAVLYSAQPFFLGAWASLRQRALGMDVPVALGIGAAFLGSVANTLRGQGDVYYDSVTMFIFLLLGSRYLELLARRKASESISRLHQGMRSYNHVLTRWPERQFSELRAAALLRPGDLVLLRPGDALAADAVIVEGNTAVDLSLLTGESMPQRRQCGDAVPGGALNAGQPVVLRVTSAAAESTLARLARLAERAGQGRPAIALWADVVAAWFVAALLVLAVCVFGAWQLLDPGRAWEVAIAVLVVSCPCALSLATPATLAAAHGMLARRGALVAQPHVLETMARVTHVVFDKTGTLTEGRMQVDTVDVLDGMERAEVLRLAAALEAGSSHPVAQTLSRYTVDDVRATATEVVAGAGVEGVIGTSRYRCGKRAWVAQWTGSEAPWPDEGGVYLACEGQWLARIVLRDSLRCDALATVEALQDRGCELLLLSGDAAAVVRQVAGRLGISRAYGDQLPDQKLALVRQLQRSGAVVAMVGDGINDAAVLRAADVSFAMGGGTALAHSSADCVLLQDRLSVLVAVARTASRALAVIRQNLAWAMVYNTLAIPAAALGLLNPWMAGIGMSASSAIVVINAMRLRRAEV